VRALTRAIFLVKALERTGRPHMGWRRPVIEVEPREPPQYPPLYGMWVVALYP
jgi:hypothetical protein